MAENFGQKIREDLAKGFKVSEATCDQYNEIYNRRILPIIEKKYLAHLVTAAEEMIDEVVRAREKKETAEDPSKKESEAPKVRRYSIVLSDRRPPKNGKSYTWSLEPGAIISYAPSNPKQDLRIFVAHELGHLLIEYGILPVANTENHANLLAFFAISGKNDFYKENVPDLIYQGKETEILGRINSVCPITKEEQVA